MDSLHFPTKCPVIAANGKGCEQIIKHKRSLIRHIKSVHDKQTTICEICKEPIIYREIARHKDVCKKNQQLKEAELLPGAVIWDRYILDFCMENDLNTQLFVNRVSDSKDYVFLINNILLARKEVTQQVLDKIQHKVNVVIIDPDMLDTRQKFSNYLKGLFSNLQ